MLFTKKFKNYFTSVVLATSLMMPTSQHCIDNSDFAAYILGIGALVGITYNMYYIYQHGKKITELSESEQVLLLSNIKLEDNIKKLNKESESDGIQKEIEALQNEVNLLKKSILIAEQSKKSDAFQVVPTQENSSTTAATLETPEEKFAAIKKNNKAEIPDFFRVLD